MMVMSEDDPMGEEDKVARIAGERRAPESQPGQEVMVVPAALFVAAVEILQTLPWKQVNAVVSGLMKCRPAQAKPKE